MAKSRIINTILVPFESWMYLRNITSEEITGKHFDNDAIEYFKKQFYRQESLLVDRCRRLYDEDFGGMKNGRMTYLSVEEMKQMLNSAGLPWKDGGTTECIDL